MLHMIYAWQEFDFIMVLSVNLNNPNSGCFFSKCLDRNDYLSVFCIKT